MKRRCKNWPNKSSMSPITSTKPITSIELKLRDKNRIKNLKFKFGNQGIKKTKREGWTCQGKCKKWKYRWNWSKKRNLTWSRPSTKRTSKYSNSNNKFHNLWLMSPPPNQLNKLPKHQNLSITSNKYTQQYYSSKTK